MKKLIILTGPQGAGNHLFSKCFATSDEIGGWKGLLNDYWQGHHKEPFNEVWQGHRDLDIDDFDGYDYWVTSVSIPYVKNGELNVPDIANFYNQVIALGVHVQIGLISRDKNILEAQQIRVREEFTLPQFMNYFADRMLPIHYLSHETLVLHKANYINYICNLIGFPNLNISSINEVLVDSNANKKYINHVDEYWLDNHVHLSISESKNAI